MLIETPKTDRNSVATSLFAQLLASERINVRFEKVRTPRFYTKFRDLVLPLWKKLTDAELYLMVGHEVGHAINTPEWMFERNRVLAIGKNYKGYLNAVEDARIERKILSQYPGLKRLFISGYRDLVTVRDYFKTNSFDIREMALVDRLNVATKCGALIPELQLTPEEQAWYDAFMATDTPEDADALATRLYAFVKEQKRQQREERKRKEEEAARQKKQKSQPKPKEKKERAGDDLIEKPEPKEQPKQDEQDEQPDSDPTGGSEESPEGESEDHSSDAGEAEPGETEGGDEPQQGPTKDEFAPEDEPEESADEESAPISPAQDDRDPDDVDDPADTDPDDQDPNAPQEPTNEIETVTVPTNDLDNADVIEDEDEGPDEDEDDEDENAGDTSVTGTDAAPGASDDDVASQRGDMASKDAHDSDSDSTDDDTDSASTNGDEDTDEDENSTGGGSSALDEDDENADGENEDDEAGEGGGDDEDDDETDEDDNDADGDDDEAATEAGNDIDEDADESVTADAADQLLEDRAAQTRSSVITVQVGDLMDPTPFITPLSVILPTIKYVDRAHTEEEFRAWKRDAQPVVSMMVQQFRAKAMAHTSQRARVAPTGRLDMAKLSQYRFNDNIFKRNTILPGGINHGLVAFVDWSGSMDEHLENVIRQALTLALFATAVGIPMDMYAFTDQRGAVAFHRKTAKRAEIVPAADEKTADEMSAMGLNPAHFPNGAVLPKVIMRQLYSTTAPAHVRQEALLRLFGLMQCAGGKGVDDPSMYPFGVEVDGDIRRIDGMPEGDATGGTPLDPAIFVATSIVDLFRKQHRLEKIATVWLTDGDTTAQLEVGNWKIGYRYDTNARKHNEAHIWSTNKGDQLLLIDYMLGRRYQSAPARKDMKRVAQTSMLFAWHKDRTHASVIGCHIGEDLGPAVARMMEGGQKVANKFLEERRGGLVLKGKGTGDLIDPYAEFVTEGIFTTDQTPFDLYCVTHPNWWSPEVTGAAKGAMKELVRRTSLQKFAQLLVPYLAE